MIILKKTRKKILTQLHKQTIKLTRMLLIWLLLFSIILVISGETFNQSDASFWTAAKLSNVQFDYTRATKTYDAKHKKATG